MIITEPKWKSYIVETTNPIFTPEQCKMIIEAGRSEPKQTGQVGGGSGGTVDTKTRTSHISWIPFKKMLDMYKNIEKLMQATNRNHFGFDGMTLTEPKWKSYVVETTGPIFTPEQCKMIIEAGRSEPAQQGQVGGGSGGKVDTKTRTSHISWIPFKKMLDMYKDIEKLMQKTIEIILDLME